MSGEAVLGGEVVLEGAVVLGGGEGRRLSHLALAVILKVYTANIVCMELRTGTIFIMNLFILFFSINIICIFIVFLFQA